ENGIRQEAYKILETILKETGSEDICQLVDCAKGYCFIGEDEAEGLRGGLSKWGKSDTKVINDMIPFPNCKECASVQTQAIFEETGGGSEVVGCNDLTPKQWENGWKDMGAGLYQHNCPLIVNRDQICTGCNSENQWR
ncbi:MAG: hypothetical protein ABIC57_03795, partial [bacterium]